jgi:hypothetical protein
MSKFIPPFLNLAPELVENVLKQVHDKKDLSNTRLACRTLNKYAVKELFKDVFVSPSQEHIRLWKMFSQDDVIRQIPRHAIIHTQPDIEDTRMGDYKERYEVNQYDELEGAEPFDAALAALSKFPNLDSIEIGFTSECAGRGSDYLEDRISENVSQRVQALKFIFQAIKDRAANETNRTIRKLTILNLQNFPIPVFTSSELYRDVMGQLEELHLGITRECCDTAPDNDYDKSELQTFPAYLCSDWLAPIAANLKGLSIYNEMENWGPFPGYLDPSGISFPKLETLALGYLTLAHDNDFDWVLAIKSLRKLILHNCMICSWVHIDTDNLAKWNVRTHDWTPMAPEEEDEGLYDGFAYGGNWSERFERIASEMPNLVNFQFGYQPQYDYEHRGNVILYSLANRDSCPIEISAARYVCFDNGILPEHWQEGSGDGNMHTWLEDDFPINVHKENLESDQKSLDALLQELRSRR